MEKAERLELMHRIGQVFTPSRPTRGVSVFAGRATERSHLTSAILEPGRHALVYGARGVGKTSLMNVVASELEDGSLPETARRFTVRVSCGPNDDFDLLWRRILSEVSVFALTNVETLVTPLPLDGVRPESDAARELLDQSSPLTSADIERLLRHAERSVVVLDEFDVLSDPDCSEECAVLLKSLSDDGAGATLVLVGVGHDITDLLTAHASVERCLEQVAVPLMQDAEVTELVEKGFNALGMTVTGEAVREVILFSRGYPAFAHSLAKKAAERAVSEDRLRVEADDVVQGAFQAMDALPFSLGQAYEQATEQKRPNDQTRLTVAACAWLGPGRFRPIEVLRVLESWSSSVSMAGLMYQLRKLSTADRGSILIQHGDKSPSFEFRDPMLIPYTIIRALQSIPQARESARATARPG